MARFSTSIFATFAISGTVATRSSPLIAGTGAFFTGSIFIAIVPPVAIILTTGRSAATAPTGSDTAMSDKIATASTSNFGIDFIMLPPFFLIIISLYID